jgi:hypothetical protein
MTDQLKKDVSYIKASVDELESFLLSDDVLRQLPDLSFTAGGILLAHKRISAANLEKQILTEWESLEGIRQQWKTAWTNKCLAEMKMRLRQWGDFILGMSSDKHESSTEYRHQVRSRAILQLLEDDIPNQAAIYVESITRKDKILEKYSVENEFVWEDEVKPGFPEPKYWFLYRVMKYEKAK